MLDIVRVSGPPVRSCSKGGKVSAYDLVIRAGPLDRLGPRRPEMHFDLSRLVPCPAAWSGAPSPPPRGL